MDSLWRRANTQNVSFRISLGASITCISLHYVQEPPLHASSSPIPRIPKWATAFLAVDYSLMVLENGKSSDYCVYLYFYSILFQAVQRCVTDCPICIMPLTDQGLYKKNSSSRPAVLLSCSHVFHATCLEAFEEFSLDKRRVCPVCRSLYHKKML